MSSSTVNPSPVQLQLDDNLVNGQRYTFVFASTNWFSTPNTGTIQGDITQLAPDFLTSLLVQFYQGNFYVTFTYEGDGSDVVSDVANSIVAASAAGSGDGLSYASGQQGAVVINTPLASTPGSGLSLLNVLQPVTSDQQAARSVAAQQQVQQVADNAQVIAPGSTSAQVAQASATAQAAQASTDQSSIATTANAGSVGSLFNSLSGLSNSTTLIILGLALAAIGYFIYTSGGVAGAKRRVGVAA